MESRGWSLVAGVRGGSLGVGVWWWESRGGNLGAEVQGRESRGRTPGAGVWERESGGGSSGKKLKIALEMAE